mmetsp:Transcript_5477/g.14856  ORF Transcript_5477/g.14856 Transcript_5477/m.14856 type:complete len:126 (-) Transcript_5477:1114-1491(-)
MSETLRKYAAFLGATGIALGAFGAHGLKNTLTQRNSMENWKTATIYQMFHASTVLVLSMMQTGESEEAQATINRAGNLMTLGTVMFSGSIYALSLGIGPKKLLGPTTPVGGLLMIGGWAMLGFTS